jgi:hypothetical protein
VIGQAFPYMPIANPGWMFPELSFGLRRERIAEVVQEVRDAGAEVVVCSPTTASTWTGNSPWISRDRRDPDRAHP